MKPDDEVEPWFEIWTAGESLTEDPWINFNGSEGIHLDSFKRAQLAAQAPAMARLLFKHQWGDTDDCGYPVCPECKRNDPAYIGSGIHPKDAHRTGHAPNCALIAVLRAAGVL